MWVNLHISAMSFFQRIFGVPEASPKPSEPQPGTEGLRARVRELEERVDDLEHESRRTLKQLRKLQGVVTGGLRRSPEEITPEDAPEPTNGDKLYHHPSARTLPLRKF